MEVSLCACRSPAFADGVPAGFDDFPHFVEVAQDFGLIFDQGAELVEQSIQHGQGHDGARMLESISRQRHRPDVVSHGIGELAARRPDGAAGLAANDCGSVAGLAADLPAAMMRWAPGVPGTGRI